jgi:hypothetical protein
MYSSICIHNKHISCAYAALIAQDLNFTFPKLFLLIWCLFRYEWANIFMAN